VVTLWRDGLVLRLPVLSNLVRTIEAARFCRTLATLLQNRVPMVRAARIVIDTLRNRAVVARLEPIIGQVKEGEGLALPLERAGILPSVAMQLVRVGEETGQLPEILGRAADMFERDVQRSTERLMTLLVPLLTIGLGAFIGGVVATIFSMLLSFNELAR
jgi:general secretion pathway protein F